MNKDLLFEIADKTKRLAKRDGIYLPQYREGSDSVRFDFLEGLSPIRGGFLIQNNRVGIYLWPESFEIYSDLRDIFFNKPNLYTENQPKNRNGWIGFDAKTLKNNFKIDMLHIDNYCNLVFDCSELMLDYIIKPSMPILIKEQTGYWQ